MKRDWPDVLGGLALALIGGLALGWALFNYDLGTLRQMGPGFFPTVLGWLLTLLGLIVALPALTRDGEVEGQRFDLPSAAAVLSAILIFGFGLRLLGLAGATFASVLVASLAAPQPGWVWRGALAVVIAVLTVAVFSYGLRMTLAVWPRLP